MQNSCASVASYLNELTYKVESNEPIVIASFQLPYKVVRDEKTKELSLVNCFHNPVHYYFLKSIRTFYMEV